MRNLQYENRKTIQQSLNVDLETAKKIQKVVTTYEYLSGLDVFLDLCEEYRLINTLDWYHNLHTPNIRNYQLCIVMFDEILENFGKEYDANINFLYSNTGDPYTNTIVYDCNYSKFGIGNIGTLKEIKGY